MLSAILLSACGGSDGDPNSDTTDRANRSSATNELFSLWRGLNNESLDIVDLRDYSFSEPEPISYFFEGGAQCDCTLTVLGDQSSGAFVTNSCEYLYGSSQYFITCDYLNVTGYYTNENGLLSVDPENGPVQTYRQ